MCVLIENFIPNLYECYATLNIKFTDGHKGYCSTIPRYMVNKPGPLVEFMLKKKDAVTPFMITSVQQVYVCTNKNVAVQSVSAKTNETNCYLVNFGNDNFICSCECKSFKHNRLPCKHFFAVFESEVGHFHELSPLYLNHPYTNIDYDVIGNVQMFGPERPAGAITDTPCDLPSNDVDLSTPLPRPKRNKLKVVKQQLLADIKVFTEKVHNITDYESIISIREKFNDAFEEANNVLKNQHGDQLCPQVNNNSVPIPARRYENDLCFYKNVPVEKVDRNNMVNDVVNMLI